MGISAKELRLGNFIYKLGKNVIEVEPETFRNVNAMMFPYDPIPLTEEWLFKFGFDKKSWKSEGIVIECFYYEKNGIVVYLIAKGFEIEIKHKDYQFNLFRVWNYVHQLQNLYFALTGEELTIKH